MNIALFAHSLFCTNQHIPHIPAHIQANPVFMKMTLRFFFKSKKPSRFSPVENIARSSMDESATYSLSVSSSLASCKSGPEASDEDVFYESNGKEDGIPKAFLSEPAVERCIKPVDDAVAAKLEAIIAEIPQKKVRATRQPTLVSLSVAQARSDIKYRLEGFEMADGKN